MEAPVRKVKGGYEFMQFFPAAELKDTTIKKNADLEDTMAKIPEVVRRYGHQAAKIAHFLKRDTVNETCKSIWHWVYAHISYKKDESGFEQLRTPARTFHDRHKGVDCDCYSIFISCILTHLGIPHVLRISKNDRDYFQHIYPVVVQPGGREIIMDCVVSSFNYEAPLKEKKDFKMELQILSGFEGGDLSGDAMGELGKVIKKRFAPGQVKKPAPKPKLFSKPQKAAPPAGKPVVQKKAKGKLLNKINKVNPTTVMLRNGVLASMKLNISNVAARLKWAYLTDQQAAQKNIDPVKFARLKSVRQRLEEIFYKVGGKPENLKQAILKGKGNKDNAVNGLGISGYDGYADYLNEYSPLYQLLGHEIYQSENVEGMEGVGTLGEPVTLATIAAASGVIAGIAGLLKQIGDIFSKKTKGSEDFDPVKTEQAEKENPAPAPPPDALPPINTPVTNMVIEQQNPVPPVIANQAQFIPTNTDTGVFRPPANAGQSFQPPVITEKTNTDVVQKDEQNLIDTNPDNSSKQAVQNNSGDGMKTPPEEDPGFWAKNKNWIIPVTIGVAGVTFLAIALTSKKSNNAPQKKTPSGGLNGVRTKRKNHQRRRKKNRLTATILL